MNFIEVDLMEKDGQTVAKVSGKDVEFLVPGGKAAYLKEKGYIGKKVTLGVRPEDIHKEKVFLDMSPESAFDAKVVIRELMGSEIFAYLDFVGNELIAKFDGRNDVSPGDELRLALDMNRVHFFDIETEESILFTK